MTATPEPQGIYIDGMGYWPTEDIYAHLKPAPISAFDIEETVAFTDRIYFVLRSSVSLDRYATQAHVDTLKQIRTELHEVSIGLARSADFRENPPLPNWAAQAFSVIKKRARTAYPIVDDIQIRATWEPRLNVRSNPEERTISVSLVTRDLLKNLNIAILNVMMPDGGTGSLSESWDEPTLDPCVGLLLALHRKVFWSVLPTFRPNSSFIHQSAINAASDQCAYLLAHEIAHIALHQGKRRSPALEQEADEFASWMTFQLASPTLSVGDIWMGVRWLYGFLMLDRLLSWRLCGKAEPAPDIDSARISIVDDYAAAFGVHAIDLAMGRVGELRIAGLIRRLTACSADQVERYVESFLSGMESRDTSRIGGLRLVSDDSPED